MTLTINNSPALGKAISVLPTLKHEAKLIQSAIKLEKNRGYSFYVHIAYCQPSARKDLEPKTNSEKPELKFNSFEPPKLEPSKEFHEQAKPHLHEIGELLLTIHNLLDDYNFEGDLKGIIKEKIINESTKSEIIDLEKLFFVLSGEIGFNDELKKALGIKSDDSFNPARLSYDISTAIHEYIRHEKRVNAGLSTTRINDSHAGF